MCTFLLLKLSSLSAEQIFLFDWVSLFQLDEAYAVLLSGYSEMSGRLGNATRVNITILKNDDPHGVIQFLPNELSITIKESKGEITYAGKYFY